MFEGAKLQDIRMLVACQFVSENPWLYNFVRNLQTCAASSECHNDAAISGDFAKAARVSINKPFRLDGTEQHTRPSSEATGSHLSFSQNDIRTFSF